MSAPTRPPAVLPRTAWTVAEVAASMGRSRRKVYDMCASGEIPSTRQGSSVVIPCAAFAEYLDALNDAARATRTA